MSTTLLATDTLAMEINRHHRECEQAVNAGLQHALEAGRLLAEAKGQCSHGEWGEWVAGNFDGSDRTAQGYMLIAKRFPELEQKRNGVADLSLRGALKLLTPPIGPRDNLTGNAEWYSPRSVIDSAREALGGIDLDPASCEIANKTVKADRYYSREDDGLSRDWAGRVFLNPPYDASTIKRFVAKLLEELRAGNVDAAILLTNNATDAAWWHDADELASAVCFTRGRISFNSPNGSPGNPTNGQTILYFGDDVEGFAVAFGNIGRVMVDYQEATTA